MPEEKRWIIQACGYDGWELEGISDEKSWHEFSYDDFIEAEAKFKELVPDATFNLMYRLYDRNTSSTLFIAAEGKIFSELK